MAGNGRYNVEEIKEALIKSEGFLYPTSRILGCSLKTVHNYLNKHPTLRETQKELKCKRDDFVEAKIFTHIKNNDVTMTIFYAKTQMKGRGYNERLEFELGASDKFAQLLKDLKNGSVANPSPEE